MSSLGSVADMDETQKVSTHSGMDAAQDDCLIAISDGHRLPAARLKMLPPWRAVLIARVADKAGMRLQRGTIGQLLAEARAVGGSGELGDWWNREDPELS